MYAEQCIQRLEELLRAKFKTSTARLSDVVLALMEPCLHYVMDCTNEFINLKNVDVEQVEYYEMIQLVALLHYSHFTNWNFEITIDQWKERGYAAPELKRLRWLQQNMKIYPATGRGSTTGQ